MASNKQQTAIDWLLEQLKINNYISDNAHWLIDEAKEMEKEQIVSSYEIAYMYGYNDIGICGEDYYKENFNQ